MTGRNLVNTVRHQNEFDLRLLERLQISVIGCGATGSPVAMLLAGLGVQNLHLWDFDVIEEHNIANQIMAYGIPDIGRPKAEVLAEVIEHRTRLKPHVHLQAVDGSQRLGQVVFLLTDTMSSRKKIWQRGIRRKLGTKLMIETRMGAWAYDVYTINPTLQSHITGWEAESDYGDEDEGVEAGVCRAKTTIGATAAELSAVAVRQFIRWLKIESQTAEAHERLEQHRAVCARTGEQMVSYFDDNHGVAERVA